MKIQKALRSLVWLLWLLYCPIVTAQIKVDSVFPGSNVKVVRIDNRNNALRIRSVKKNGDVYQLWFYFGVSGFDSQKPLTLFVEGTSEKMLPALPAFSYDKKNWDRTPGFFKGDGMEYIIRPKGDTLYFATGYPYLYAQLRQLEQDMAPNAHVQVSDLTRSEEGRVIKLFRITDGDIPDPGKALVWILARNHAFESHSNHVIEGLVRYLASDDQKAAFLRKNAIVFVVPMMDVDMVERGGSGKDQERGDFNRNWENPEYWNAIKAVKRKIAETAATNDLRIFIDSHDPFPGSKETNYGAFFYSLHNEGGHPKSEKLDFFRNLLRQNGGYRFLRRPSYKTKGMNAASYIDSVYPHLDIATSMETGWVNRTDGEEYTIPRYHLHGEIIGKGISDFIRRSPASGQESNPK
ncbi:MULTISPECIES: M14-type cytosolic carboxypeptidase [Flavobacteriaceae]|uniref:M14-type cytosolic carboxypeptidase n=1 Tax=Flavobacteriaceae TaxID=49546 RepID=UPI001492AC85|nr:MULTISPECIES: M14-type cytosolic carboxypeptidase [Allomuricauda]MDC6366828.1 M14-type cytosolic carboxypeptidase [Muricauda sp. AC10]